MGQHEFWGICACSIEKHEARWRGGHRLTETKSDRPRFLIIFGNKNGKKIPKLVGREVFFRGVRRCAGGCIYGSVVFSGEAPKQRGC